MLEACAKGAPIPIAVPWLSTMIPLVEPGLFGGTGAVLVTAAGGHAGVPVTSMEMTQPALLIPQAPPPGMGVTLLARFPMLKKIQSFSTPDPPPYRSSCSRSQPLPIHQWPVSLGANHLASVLIDEYTRECLAIRAARRLGSAEVIEVLAEVMLRRGIPGNIRSDNGPEFIAQELRKWLAKV
jgi:hypothetical protein